MFDIVSFIRERIFRRAKLTPVRSGEEVSEKQTTKMGYFLLICMFFAIMSSAQWTLSIIEGIPKSPTPVPECVYQALDILDPLSEWNTYRYYSESNCILISENPVYDLTTRYTLLRPIADTIVSYEEKITILQQNKNTLDEAIQNAHNDYNTSLYEKTSGESTRIYDTKTLQETIQKNRDAITKIETQIAENKNLIQKLRSQYAVDIQGFIGEKNQAETDYRTAYLKYKTIIAVLSFVFGLLVFTLLYKIYVRQKIKNSPHTIIFSVATFAYGLIIIQISALFIWDIIPHKYLELLLMWLSAFTPLLYLVQFLWPLVIITIFGYLVYRIQKRLYSPENILKRFVSDKKCPNCHNGVDTEKAYCPLCSHEIQIHCPHCKALTLKGMPYCSSCGQDIHKNQEK